MIFFEKMCYFSEKSEIRFWNFPSLKSYEAQGVGASVFFLVIRGSNWTTSHHKTFDSNFFIFKTVFFLDYYCIRIYVERVQADRHIDKLDRLKQTFYIGSQDSIECRQEDKQFKKKNQTSYPDSKSGCLNSQPDSIDS